MPKRSNAFQKLITRIYQQSKDDDANVTESALLCERDSGTQREVDILLEKNVFGTLVRIAVECRRRKHKDDIQWIDGLIGKYRDLTVHKVIAVSSSGFTKGAFDKATANKIDALTLGVALEKDWPSEFIRWGIADVVLSNTALEIECITEPPVSGGFSMEPILYSDTGEVLGTVEEAGRKIVEIRQQDLKESIEQVMKSKLKVLDDLQKKEITAELTYSPPVCVYLRNSVGTAFQVTTFVLKMKWSFKAEDVKVDHFLLGTKGVSVGILEGIAGKSTKIVAVQELGKPPSVVGYVEAEKAKKK